MAKWLGGLMVLTALYISLHMFGYSGWYSRQTTREILFFTPLMQLYFIGPMLYFYVSSILDPHFKLGKKQWLHFLPGVLYLLYSLLIFIVDKLVLDEFYFYSDGRDKDLANWYQITGFLSMLSYLALSLRKYKRYRAFIFDTLSYAHAIAHQWVFRFLIAFFGILLFRLLFFIIHPNWGQFGSQFWYYTAFSIIASFVAFAGYAYILKTNTIKELRLADPEGPFKENAISQESNTERQSPLESAQPKSNKLPELELQKWKERIHKQMIAGQLYQNPSLNLSDLAAELGTNNRILSAAINQGFQLNFNDYINKYRIEAVKQAIDNKEHLNKSLLGLALEAGFNSKATFNRAFKKHTQTTPQNYIKKLPD